MNSIIISSLADIDNAAKEFLIKTSEHTVFCFYAGMGVGKTTFIKALCKQLGVTDNVASPTFAIINEYKNDSPKNIFHFDLYRLKDIQELQNIGAEEYLYSGHKCFIEWPEIAEPILPDTFLHVSITELEDGRREIVF